MRCHANADDILIYPSTLKYGNSKKEPYISLLDRLSNFLRQDDAVLITCGYSFGDMHINERIATSLKYNVSSHIFAFIYDKNDKSDVATEKDKQAEKIAKENNRLSVYGSRMAVIGCHKGIWKLKREPDNDDTLNINLYFDEDAPVGKTELGKEHKGDEKWTGEGILVLPDFARFVDFLSNMVEDQNQ